MKDNIKEKWLKLFEIADKIKKEKPWKRLSDSDLLIYINDDDSNNPLYFCTMGAAGEHYSIAIYKGDEIEGYKKILDNLLDFNVAINYQECVKVNYLSRKETLNESIDLVKELGLKYHKEWTAFEVFKRGYYFYMLDEDKIDLMTNYLNIYYDMYNKYINSGINVNFAKGEGFIRHHNSKTGENVDSCEIVQFVSKKYKKYMLDGDQRERLKKCLKNKTSLEVDFMNYIPFAIDDQIDDKGRYMLPLIYMVADKNTQFIYRMNLYEGKNYGDKYVKLSVGKLIDIMEKIGKPKSIYVRDERTYNILEDLCKEANIDLHIDIHLHAIDAACSLFINEGL